LPPSTSLDGEYWLSKKGTMLDVVSIGENTCFSIAVAKGDEPRIVIEDSCRAGRQFRVVAIVYDKLTSRELRKRLEPERVTLEIGKLAAAGGGHLFSDTISSFSPSFWSDPIGELPQKAS